MIEKRKQSLFEMNQKSTKKTSYPKYSENKHVKWWKTGKSFVETPDVNSHHMLLQDKKAWAKNDELLLADFSEESAPIDDFKKRTSRLPKKNQRAVTAKPSEVKIEIQRSENGKQRPIVRRWTNQVAQFSLKRDT